jgi:hypothetical protein
MLLYGQFDPTRFAGGVRRWKRVFGDNVVRIIAFEEHFPILASGKRVGQLIHQWALGLPERERP